MDRCQLIALACAGTIAGGAMSALVGWLLRVRAFAAGRSEFIPMAPSTALAFIACATAIGAIAVAGDRTRRRVTYAALAVVLAMIATGMIEFFVTRMPFGVDSLLLDGLASTAPRGEPIGRMALSTAVAFTFATPAIAVLAQPRARKAYAILAHTCASVVGLIGAAFALGYAYSHPLMYGRSQIPMALTTAGYFMVLAAGVAALAIRRLVIVRRVRAERRGAALRTASAALTFAEQKFQLVVDSISDYGIFLLDPDGRIVTWNSGASSVTGYDTPEVIGRYFSIFYGEGEEAEAQAADELAEARANGRAVREGWRTRKDGTRFWDHEVLTALPGGDTTGGFVKITRDLTAQRTLRHELERDRELQHVVLESLREGIVACDAQGNLTLFNRATREFHGADLETIPPEEWSDRYDLYAADGTTKLAKDMVPLFRALNGEIVNDAEMVIAAKGREPRAVVASGRAIYNAAGEKLGAVVAMHDITDRKRAEQRELELAREQAAREQAEAAEKRISAALAEVEEARREADRANLAKSEFLSRMSHELRTPLNAILGFAQLLDLELTEPVDKEGATQILKAGRHLLNLINEVLEISRIEAGRLDLSREPVPVADVVSEAAIMLRHSAAERDVAVKLDVPSSTYALADQQRLKQVLLNLLSNAIKFNVEGGTVLIACERAHDRVRISVRDTGRGIKGDHLSRLFTPFERLDADAAQISGTGLGLALSRKLIEAMGGTIEVESQLGIGTTFVIELPTAETPTLAIPEPVALSSTAVRTGALRILCIEDNLSNLRLIERMVAHRPGVEVIGAMQGSVGLHLARNAQPDLVLLDVHLPDMDGREVLNRLRADPYTNDVPVVVMSADATERQRQRMMAAGAQTYLTKPLAIEALLDVLDRFLVEEAA